MDFTDMLWSVLHRVESYRELCFALTSVLERIKREELRPFIYANSKTRVSEILREVIRGGNFSGAVTAMSEGSRLPLQILVEVGVENLRRDYVHLIVSSYLAVK